MAQANFLFPRGFLWGSATAAHQVEGQNTNNNWWLGKQPGRIIHGIKLVWRATGRGAMAGGF